MTPEHRLAIAAALTGRRASAEAIARMSASKRALWQTAEHRAKMAEVASRRRRVPYDAGDVATWTGSERRVYMEGRSCEWPGGCVKPTRHLDHDHRTGRPRGVLCAFHNCRVLGIIENYGTQAAEYLARA